MPIFRQQVTIWWRLKGQCLTAQVTLEHIDRRSLAHSLRQGWGYSRAALWLQHLLDLDIEGAETCLVRIHL